MNQDRDDGKALPDLASDPATDLASDPSSDLAPDLASDRGEDLHGDLGSALQERERTSVDGFAEEVVWFDADELARTSAVSLAEQPTVACTDGSSLLRSPSGPALLVQLERPYVSLATLPGWPGSGASGQGLGPAFGDLIGSVGPGTLLLWTGRERGVGRSSLLAQLGDGLALRRDPNGPASPVVWVSDRGPESWRARSLARWTGLAPQVFVDPDRARAHPQLAERVAAYETSEWGALAQSQRFIDARIFSDRKRSHAVLEDLRAWRDESGAGGEAWLVLIIDPLESLEGDVVEQAAHLDRLAKSEGWIILASCDELGDRQAQRRLDRHVHARVCVHAPSPGRLALELCHSPLGQRGRVGLRFEPTSGRFEPVSEN